MNVVMMNIVAVVMTSTATNSGHHYSKLGMWSVMNIADAMKNEAH